MSCNKPNVIVIMSDQHRYDCVGYANAYPVQTPHIDQLAREGLWFNRAYTPIAVCCPARQALLTGLRPERHGALWNLGFTPVIGSLNPDMNTWPRQLRDAGYRCSYVGKWQESGTHKPADFGFEQYISPADHKAYLKAKGAAPAPLQNGWFGEIDPIEELEDTECHWLAQQASDTIRSYAQQAGPFHVRLNFSSPHLPCTPHKSFAALYDKAKVPKWTSFGDPLLDKPRAHRQQLINWEIENRSWEEWSHTVAMYYGMITQIDDAIGRVLQTVEELGIGNDTLIVYTADHGDFCGGHGMIDKHMAMYEDIQHVPFILNWPGHIPAGTRSDAFVYNALDFCSTLCELTGLPAPAQTDGRSLVPLLGGDVPEDWRQEIVCTYNGMQFGLYTSRMLRDNRYKYVWNPTDRDELYDLQKDPDELQNRIHYLEYQSIAADMRKRLYDQLVALQDPWGCSPWMKPQLLYGRKAEN